MIKYQKQASPDHVWVVAFDTICEGWNCCMTEEDGEDVISLYTEEKADEEIDEMVEFMNDHSYFKVHRDVYIHNRKCIITFDNENCQTGYIEGYNPEKQ